MQLYEFKGESVMANELCIIAGELKLVIYKELSLLFQGLED